MILAAKSRLLKVTVILLGLSLPLCTAAAEQTDDQASRQEIDSSLSRYRGMNSSQPDLAMLSRKFSLQQVLSAKSPKAADANWIYHAPPVAQSFANSKVDLQDLMERLPLAAQTLQIVTTTADSHPQVTRIVRFLTRHVDPQF